MNVTWQEIDVRERKDGKGGFIDLKWTSARYRFAIHFSYVENQDRKLHVPLPHCLAIIIAEYDMCFDNVQLSVDRVRTRADGSFSQHQYPELLLIADSDRVELFSAAFAWNWRHRWCPSLLTSTSSCRINLRVLQIFQAFLHCCPCELLIGRHSPRPLLMQEWYHVERVIQKVPCEAIPKFVAFDEWYMDKKRRAVFFVTAQGLEVASALDVFVTNC